MSVSLFSRFQEFPKEIRDQIWDTATLDANLVAGRIIELRWSPDAGQWFATKDPALALLDVCVEARDRFLNKRPYQLLEIKKNTERDGAACEDAARCGMARLALEAGDRPVTYAQTLLRTYISYEVHAVWGRVKSDYKFDTMFFKGTYTQPRALTVDCITGRRVERRGARVEEAPLLELITKLSQHPTVRTKLVRIAFQNIEFTEPLCKALVKLRGLHSIFNVSEDAQGCIAQGLQAQFVEVGGIDVPWIQSVSMATIKTWLQDADYDISWAEQIPLRESDDDPEMPPLVTSWHEGLVNKNIIRAYKSAQDAAS